VTAAVLYCQNGCPACAGIARQLAGAGVHSRVRDVTTEPDALAAVARLGYQSLPVLVSPDGATAAGAQAADLARRLASKTTAAEAIPAAGGTGHSHPIEDKES